MATPTQPEGLSPALIFQTVNAHQRTEVLKTAIELELFTAIAEGLKTPESLAKHCGILFCSKVTNHRIWLLSISLLGVSRPTRKFSRCVA